MKPAYASALRTYLSELNQRYARQSGVEHVLSYGESPVVVYPATAETHGNFLPETYAAILHNPNWRKRLSKVHTQARTCLPKTDYRWKELDSSTSSDALLMNVFCHPDVPLDGKLATLLGIERDSSFEFGYRARVPLAAGRGDATEVDLRAGGLLIESKLTESGFQCKSYEHVHRYRDFAEVFDKRRLRKRGDQYENYQLIRNVLAAHAHRCRFCVCLDQRRPDLLESWFEVMSAVKFADLKLRLQVITWQEIATVLPPRLQDFLLAKYGINERGASFSSDGC